MSTVRATLYTVAHKYVTVNIMSISSANHNRFGYFWNSLTHVILLPAEVPCIVGRSSTSETDSACMVSTIVLAVYDHSLQLGSLQPRRTEPCRCHRMMQSPRPNGLYEKILASSSKIWPQPGLDLVVLLCNLANLAFFGQNKCKIREFC